LLLQFSVLPRNRAEAQEKIWQKDSHGREHMTKSSTVRTDRFSSEKWWKLRQEISEGAGN